MSDTPTCATAPCDEAPEFTFKRNANDEASLHVCAKHAGALQANGLVLVGKVPSAVMKTEVES